MSRPQPDPPGRLFRWRFGAVEFDEARRELRVAGLPVDVEHKPLEVLSLLLRHAGEVVGKDVLFAHAWAGRVTVDHVLATAVGKLRKVLDDAGRARIVTVPRIGYRFDGDVERVETGTRAAAPTPLAPGQPVPGRERFVLEHRLDLPGGGEAWRARQPGSDTRRVFKFALDGAGLAALKREAGGLRTLREGLGERDDIVQALDWNFDTAPQFLELEDAGDPLPDWIARGPLAGLSVDARVALFLPVVDAVAAAHAVGVLHGRLEPAAVRASPRGDVVQLRVADFAGGWADAPDAGDVAADDDDPVHAAASPWLAPERLAGAAATVRSDVYALGVLLWQLLAGDLRRPLGPGWERDVADPLLRRDIAQATDADPSRRTASAAALAERLRDLPARRERQARDAAAALAAAALQRSVERARARRPWVAALGLVLGGAVIASSLLWRQAERQRAEAEREAARAEASIRFFDRALATLSTGTSGYDHDPTIRDMLEYASDPQHGRMPADPQVRGDVHVLLGRSWRLLGEPANSANQYRAAVAAYARALGPAHPTTLRARYALVRALAYRQTREALDEGRATLATADRLAGARLRQDSALALDAALERGLFHLAAFETRAALDALRRADRLQRTLAPDDAATAALVRGGVAEALRRYGNPEDTLAWLAAARADPLLAPRRIGAVSVALMDATAARALHDLGRHAQALPLARGAAAASRRHLGPDDYFTLTQRATVAGIEAALGACATALPQAADVRQRTARRFGPDRMAALLAAAELAQVEVACGAQEAGTRRMAAVRNALRLHFGARNVPSHALGYALAQAELRRGRVAQAADAAARVDTALLQADAPGAGWPTRIADLRAALETRGGPTADAGAPAGSR